MKTIWDSEVRLYGSSLKEKSEEIMAIKDYTNSKPYKGLLENIEGYISNTGHIHVTGTSEGHPEFNGMRVTTSRVLKAAICYINDVDAMGVIETKNSRYGFYGEDCKKLEELCKGNSTVELNVCNGFKNEAD